MKDNNREPLRSVRHQRDVGVIVDETLKPLRQCAKAANSANSIRRAIQASFKNITPTLLYGTFMRSQLEYSFKAWRPGLKKDIQLLEDVQRRLTKHVKGVQGIKYEKKAQFLNLDSPSCRTGKGDIILVYKILHGFLEGVQWRNFFQMADTSRLGGHPLKLRRDRSRLDLRMFTFSQRVVKMWNDRPADVVTAQSAKAFQNKLEVHLKNLPRRSQE